MAGKVTVNKVQLGNDATATKNFVLLTNADGSGKLARGNDGATTQDIVTWDANGRIAMPQTVVAFRAHLGSNQSIATTTVTKVALNVEDWDTANAFDNATNFRFQPSVPGYYSVNAAMSALGSGVSALVLQIMKNGVSVARNTQQVSFSTPSSVGESDTVYLNGSTDYLELWAQVNGTSGTAFGAGADSTFMSATLLAKA